MACTHSFSDCNPAAKGGAEAERKLVDAFLDHLRGAGLSGPLYRYAGAARHFLFWLAKCRTPLTRVDETIVHSFARHRCHCRNRYRPSAVTNPAYIAVVRRFVRFLEDRGDIPIANDIGALPTHLTAFAHAIKAAGYSPGQRRGYHSEAEHFVCWIRLSRIRWSDFDEAVIRRFAYHDCCCPIYRKRGRLVEPTGPAQRRRGANSFIAFLRKRGTIPAAVPLTRQAEHPRLNAYRLWLGRHCGATDTTVRRYLHEASRWFSALGSDPAVYDATTIRRLVLEQEPQRSRSSLKLTATILRSYLRFLGARGECRPELVYAVPSVPRRRLATLPSYANTAMIERIVASCDATTPVGIRDRAIILLLARLGLRADDICQLRLADIDWANGQLHVHGKGRRTVRLPLPQDAGDALLAYLEHVRPRVNEERIFLRIQAPFTPFSSSSEISGIVARVLARAGIDGIPTGAHLFRHSLATTMLREGGSLESVGAILRHNALSTTAIYAKVDVTMLEKVAQPWLGGIPC